MNDGEQELRREMIGIRMEEGTYQLEEGDEVDETDESMAGEVVETGNDEEGTI
jgi:hypothetical protein